MTFKHDFKHTLPHVAMTTSMDIDIDRATNVEMDTTIEVDPDHGMGGWYETYDLETGGDRFYASGALEVEFDQDPQGGNQLARLVGYDGCFELPDYIIKALEDKGVIIDL